MVISTASAPQGKPVSTGAEAAESGGLLQDQEATAQLLALEPGHLHHKPAFLTLN